MAMEFKFGLMVHATKAIGNITKLAVKENSGMLMVMSSRENGKKTKQTGMASMSI